MIAAISYGKGVVACFFFIFFLFNIKILQNEVLMTTGLQTTKLHNKNDNPGSKNP